MRRLATTSLVLAGLLALQPAFADAVSDRLTAAIAANEAGDLKTVSAELSAAMQALALRKSDLLVAVLPPAPDGWTRTMNESQLESLAATGGGSGAEARYDSPDGTYVTVSLVMDSPLMAMMMGMFANPDMLPMLGKTVDVNGATFLDQSDSLLSVVDQRIMITINGGPTETLMPFAQAIDYTALARFDTP